MAPVALTASTDAFAIGSVVALSVTVPETPPVICA
jgi:hypothetical protein